MAAVGLAHVFARLARDAHLGAGIVNAHAQDRACAPLAGAAAAGNDGFVLALDADAETAALTLRMTHHDLAPCLATTRARPSAANSPRSAR